MTSLLRHISLRPRLTSALAVGLLCWLTLPSSEGPARLLLAWDSGIALYILLTAVTMARSTLNDLRRHAAQQDEGRILILLFTIMASIASLGATMVQIGSASSASSVALTGVTVLLSWSFLQIIFALHYAHEYYGHSAHGKPCGLEFPGGDAKPDYCPDYWDFVYFAFTIGTTAQTSDIGISSPLIRRTVTIHSVVGFFYNTTILALAVNVAAGLIK